MNSIRRFTFLPLVLLLILMTAVAVYADRTEVVEDYDYEDDGLAVVVMVNRDYAAEEFSYQVMALLLEANG